MAKSISFIATLLIAVICFACNKDEDPATGTGNGKYYVITNDVNYRGTISIVDVGAKTIQPAVFVNDMTAGTFGDAVSSNNGSTIYTVTPDGSRLTRINMTTLTREKLVTTNYQCFTARVAVHKDGILVAGVGDLGMPDYHGFIHFYDGDLNKIDSLKLTGVNRMYDMIVVDDQLFMSVVTGESNTILVLNIPTRTVSREIPMAGGELAFEFAAFENQLFVFNEQNMLTIDKVAFTVQVPGTTLRPAINQGRPPSLAFGRDNRLFYFRWFAQPAPTAFYLNSYNLTTGDVLSFTERDAPILQSPIVYANEFDTFLSRGAANTVSLFKADGKVIYTETVPASNSSAMVILKAN